MGAPDRDRTLSLAWLPDGFGARLGRDSGWSAADVDLLLREYARFAWLASRMSGAVPSKPVDAVWHLHLLFTEDYWGRFCEVCLGRPLHHRPGTGASDDAEAFRDGYALTLAAYEAEFGEPAPERAWPRGGKAPKDAERRSPRARWTRSIRRLFT